MRVWLALLLLIGWVGPAAAQIDVSLPDIQGDPGDEVVIPVLVSDVTGSNVTAFWFRLVFDPTVVEFMDIVLVGSVAEGSLASTNASTEGEFVVACAIATTRPFSGSGVLIYLTARLRAEGHSALEFDEFTFNDDGIPGARLFAGSATSGAPTYSESDEHPGAAFRLRGHFPEPAADEVSIRIEVVVPGPVHVRIFDLLGREIAADRYWWDAASGSTILLSVGDLSAGTYIYSLTSRGFTANRMLTISR